MAVLECDEKGRVVIPKEMRNELGVKFYAFKSLDEIILRPVPKNPLKELQILGKKLPKDMSVLELKKKAQELAMKEILDEVKEREKLKHNKD